MSLNYATTGRYIFNKEKVREICFRNFGKEHKVRRSPSGQKIDNHGNWKYYSGHILFRYEKDLTWFLLAAQEYEDSPGKPWFK
ncbi:MAG TPA: hypothetical protein VFM18_18085 [Methanosarcina sp.]|nr:hypothetical protein [Methanosarcina sp.]